MQILKYCLNDLEETQEILSQICPEQYNFPCEYLGRNSVGQHVRHVLEFYQCLLNQLDGGQVDYDRRERNQTIEQDPQAASHLVRILQDQLMALACDRRLKVSINLNYQENKGGELVESSLERELAYALTHSIHHKALVRVALKEQGCEEIVSECFGVAPGTIQYRQVAGINR